MVTPTKKPWGFLKNTLIWKVWRVPACPGP